MNENITVLTDENFDSEVINFNGTVLVDFWAEWCGPCQMLGPIVEQIAGEFTGRIKVGKFDVDKNVQVTGKYKIRAIPTLIIFRDGQVREQIVGLQSKSAIIQRIEEIMA